MKKGLLALAPIAAMIVLLVVFAIIYGGVSNAPLLFIFVLAAIVGVALTRGVPFKERVAIFSRGAGSENLLLMVWIFMLAGAFAATAKEMGAAEAMVNLTLRFLPVKFALAGLFLAACLTSLCMGTSVGTIVALMPIAAGLADKTSMALPLVAAAVVGGAFFGDNLSFISDTTIVATQTQGCRLSDKFRFNVKMVLPDPKLAECIEQGLMDGVMTGVLARYPMTDIGVAATGVTLIDPEVSDEIALRGAAVMGFREAAEAAQPEFLEPIMKLEITTPPESVGEVLGDINARRGTVLDMEQRGDMQIVHARVPMAQMFGYATAIRSLTKGRASYSMEPDSFDLVPRNVREELLAR